ncbi:MAG: hypothetical protein MI975_07505 [Cytophagales bacterium]|nr:hypothetical protein [Cytophagales bacterium]
MKTDISMNHLKIPLLSIIIPISMLNVAVGQGQDSIELKKFTPYKNVIRYNLTPNILGFSSLIFGYERVVKPYQTFSINAGYLALGKSGKKENEDFQLTRTKSSSGFSIAADYRFYFKSENKYAAPRGVYIGPYLANYNFSLSTGLQTLDPDAPQVETLVDSKINITNIGVELGYQFVIKDRFTLDLILIGPSYSAYGIKMDVVGDTRPPEEDIDDTLEALRDILFERYPWLKTLVEEGEVDVRGNKTHWGLGFRYVMQVGFRF